MMTMTRRRPAADSAPPKEPAHARLALTHAELREAIRAVFYPRLPTWDTDGQARVDRATQRVVDAIEARR